MLEMKRLAILIIISLASCSEQQRNHEPIDTALLEDFRAIANDGDFEKLAQRIHPVILETFRRRLEFTTSFPMEGSWITGSKDKVPTTQELESLSDKEFFVRYMTGHESELGNPFQDMFSYNEVIAATAGSKGYKSYVVIMDTEYAIPVTIIFTEFEKQWVLFTPSFVENFANRVRAARGKIPEG